MEKSSNENSSVAVVADDDHEDSLISSLPRTNGSMPGYFLCQYQGFWHPSIYMDKVISLQNIFESHDKDVILATFPKSGTTWIKSITFSIVNRHHYTLSTTPLLTTTPHELVPMLELLVYNSQKNEFPDLSSITSPRLFSTHISYNSLPESMKSSSCKIIYICRNPLDVIVSLWHFCSKSDLQGSSPGKSIGEMVESFCKGEIENGPFWEHVLGYYKKSLEMPEKFMFLKYEDLKEDANLHIKKLASFIGFPFSAEEEKEGVIGDIAELCSLRNMKEMEVNKTGKFSPFVDNKAFFRKGEVGDWVNHLTPSMVENIDKLIHERFAGSGLIFKKSN